MGHMACTELQCLYNRALYLYLYLYSPYGLYGLYRASVPVQRCTLPLPTPLLPLWTVRPVQSLSACTTAHFTLSFTFRSGHKREYNRSIARVGGIISPQTEKVITGVTVNFLCNCGIQFESQTVSLSLS